MDTISAEELKLNYPRAFEQINKHGFTYYSKPKHIKIRAFLERQGYSLSCIPDARHEKWVPQINYDGRIYDVDDRKFQTSDFDQMTLKKALEKSVLYALWDYDKHCPLR